MSTRAIPVLSFQEGLRHRLRDLAQHAEDLQRFPDDRRLRERTGYSALHTARYVSELVYRSTHGVEDVAPGLRGLEALPMSLGQMRTLLREVRTNQASTDAMTAMQVALTNRDDPHEVATSAAMAGWLLLGARELGGVMSAWQLPTIFFDLMSWSEHIDFNQFILDHAQALYQPSADAAAAEYGLPNRDFLLAGSIGNIAKACYRAVAETKDAEERMGYSDRGDTAMHDIEETFSKTTRDELWFPTMRAMRAACAGVVGRQDEERAFWLSLDADARSNIVRQVRKTEPSEALVSRVEESCSYFERALR